MNIVIINCYDVQGGAARAAHRLHTGLSLRGHNSSMLVRHKSSDELKVHSISTNMSPETEDELIGCDMLRQYYIEQNRSKISNTFFSFAYPAFDIASHPLVESADILNLHWVASFQSPATIRSLINLGKPVIWTMHDQNPFTGGCHYTAGCSGYEADCFPCPQLLKDPCRLPSEVLKEKRSFLDRTNLMLVSPSKWLADCARKSRVFSSRRVEVIPNGLDTTIFFPHDKTEAKKSFGLQADDVVVLVGADSGRDRRKGYHVVREVVTRCLRDAQFCQLVKEGRVHLFAFGSHQEKIDHMGFPVRKLGQIEDDSQLSLAYAAADVFLFPSLEDNLPNTVLEAMSCGTPVLAFKTGGVGEMISDGIDGYLISLHDVASMTDRLLFCIQNPNALRSLSANARRKIETDYTLNVQASRYETLFRELLKGNYVEDLSAQCVPYVCSEDVPGVASALGMSNSLKRAVEGTVFLLNKTLLHDLRKVQTELVLSQKQLGESIQEKSDRYREVLYLQHQVNCLSSGRGAAKTLFLRLLQKMFRTEFDFEDRNIVRTAVKHLIKRWELSPIMGGCRALRNRFHSVGKRKTEDELNAVVNSLRFSALARARAIQGNIDEDALLRLFSFGETIKKMVCIEPSLDMVQAAYMLSCSGVDVLCIGENHELLIASRVGLHVRYGDGPELLHSPSDISLHEYDCLLLQTKQVLGIADFLADAAKSLPVLMLYRSETVPCFTLPQFSLEQTIGDFKIMHSCYLK